MEYVLTVARTGSFSKAAKELFVSQPNISSSITSLEDELGFQIFQRTNQGVTITTEGLSFLKHANNIMTEFEKIPAIVKEEPYRKLSIGCAYNHTLVSQAFIKLCAKFQDSSKINFSIYSDSSKQIIENVYLNESDLGIILVNPDVLTGYINTAEKKSLRFQAIKEVAINVNIHKDHPLLKKDSFNFEDLYNYPFVNYHFNTLSNFSLISDFPEIFSMGLVNLDKIINVDEKETRRNIVISTDAFSIGTAYHPNMARIDEIVSIPIPGVEMVFALIVKDNQPYSEELELFMNLIMEEFLKLVIE